MAFARAAKQSEDMSRFARHLVLIADSFSENKNNTLFAFASDLVLRRWYDKIDFFYGPVGHTHSGGDVPHRIHNEVCGNFTSPTLVHFIAHYPHSWRQEGSRPAPCVQDVQYDWDAFYKQNMRKVAGHTNTPSDPVAVRAFRVQRGPDGIVSMLWKTKAESGEWRGADGQVGTPGFVVLQQRPRGMPTVVPPIKEVMEKYYQQLTGAKMTSALTLKEQPSPRHGSRWLLSVG
jgi:hypothetical protein